MSLITPAKKFARRAGGNVPRSRQGFFDAPLTESELLGFRSMLTQAGSLLASNAVKTASVKENAITGFWSESGTAGYTGEFADITVTRKAKTELLFWTLIGIDDIFTEDMAVFIYRNLYVFRDSTQLYRFGENLPLIAWEYGAGIDPEGSLHGGGFRSFHYIDGAEVEGEKEYIFHYKNNSPAGNNFASQGDAGVLIYYIFMMERKR